MGIPSRHERRVARDFVTGGVGLLLPRDQVQQAEAAELVAGSASPREAWVRWLAPRFQDGQALYFTGTYRDDYGIEHGLMLPRNVHKDFRRFLLDQGLTDREFISGVEHHRYRDVLHLHAVVGGSFSEFDRTWLKAQWESQRGFARALPVLDGCESYVTKYALKGDTESFDWNIA